LPAREFTPAGPIRQPVLGHRDIDRPNGTGSLKSFEITVCRLVAPEAVRVGRLLRRMPPGPSREWHVDRTVELESILARLACEEFTVENGDRPLRHVALDVLVRAGRVTEEGTRTSMQE